MWSSGCSSFFSHSVVSLTCKFCYLAQMDVFCSCSKGGGDLAWPFVKQIRHISVFVFAHYHNYMLHFASGSGQVQITRNTTQFPSCYPLKGWKGKHYDKLFLLCYLTVYLFFLQFLFKSFPCFSHYLFPTSVWTSWKNPGKHSRCFQTLAWYYNLHHVFLEKLSGRKVTDHRRWAPYCLLASFASEFVTL